MVAMDMTPGLDSTMAGPDERVILNHSVVHPDEWPHVVLRGASADLAALHHEGTYSTFFTGPRELLLMQHHSEQQEADGLHSLPGIRCRVKWRYGDQEVDEESEGNLFITVAQVLFCSSSSNATTTTLEEDKEDVSFDWAIGATCILLHAMADEPELSIYLQVASSSSDDNESLEVTIMPLDPNDGQAVFDGLCKLVAKHPLQLDDDDGDGPGFGGGPGFELDDMIWAPSAGMRSMDLSGANFYDEDEDDAAPESERAAMLNRLDNMLVVNPEFEVRAGQFDDADEVESKGHPQ